MSLQISKILVEDLLKEAERQYVRDGMLLFNGLRFVFTSDKYRLQPGQVVIEFLRDNQVLATARQETHPDGAADYTLILQKGELALAIDEIK